MIGTAMVKRVDKKFIITLYYISNLKINMNNSLFLLN